MALSWSTTQQQSHPSSAYRTKKRWVRNLWCLSLLSMLLLPLAAQLALGLATTLLSLVILDETP